MVRAVPRTSLISSSSPISHWPTACSIATAALLMEATLKVVEALTEALPHFEGHQSRWKWGLIQWPRNAESEHLLIRPGVERGLRDIYRPRGCEEEKSS